MEKYLILLVLLAGCATAQPDFHVAISLTDNSVTETVKIDGYKGTYSGVTSGDFTLSDADLQALTLLVRENGLMIDREATVSSGDPQQTFEVTWTNEMGGQSATGKVSGVVASEKSDAPEDESKFAAEQVMQFVQSKLGTGS